MNYGSYEPSEPLIYFTLHTDAAHPCLDCQCETADMLFDQCANVV